MKLTIIILCLLSSIIICHCNDKIRLTDISSLTLYSNRKTNGRRSPGVPQLECVGGSAHCDNKYIPSVVQCSNVGSDGYDVQWSCKAELGTTLKFGTIDVSCEGYDYPNDKFVLKGSCGLRYTLDKSESNGGNHYNPNKNQYNAPKTSNDPSTANFTIIILIVVVVAIILYCYNTMHDTTPARATCPPPAGFRPEFTEQNDFLPNNGAPPPYNSIFNDNKYGRQRTTNNEPGFWTGLGAGGLMGYLFGSSTRTRNYEPTTPYMRPEARQSYDYDTHTDRRSRSRTPEFRTATGYGGTSRR